MRTLIVAIAFGLIILGGSALISPTYAGSAPPAYVYVNTYDSLGLDTPPWRKIRSFKGDKHKCGASECCVNIFIGGNNFPWSCPKHTIVSINGGVLILPPACLFGNCVQ